MEIKADSYITNTTVYRLSIYSYGVAVLALISLLFYNWLTEDVNQTVIIILGLLIILAGIIGRIASTASGNYYWHHIKNKLRIDKDSIELASVNYGLKDITLLKFNITDFENSKPFLYKYILKDTRNMIRFKSEEDIVQIHFKPENKSENDYLKELKQLWNI
ncbi:hypothetical protein [[Muricauda] lutisoli]|uniref:YcxB-like protein domain-containing protein n=1 Tax=[Muricauda] lutisoli TaxID=2816035 RepID=A0ABS3EU23_9FLAO|nr:hypothetical protein [[Muricauda] lutisoli]MBO0329750.1 hypothetical protein [[Muricauda] lutisoli]